MLRRLFLAVLTFLPMQYGEANDLLVYKCQEGDHHVYQSTPCADVELKRWTARDGIRQEQGVERVKASRSQSQSNERSRGTRISATRLRNNEGGRIDACAQARKGRERAYAKAGLKRDFAMSSLWDNKVHQACW